MDPHRRPKILIPIVWYQNFLHPNRLNSRPPTRIEVIKVINRLRKEINQQQIHYEEFGRFDPDLMYMERQIRQYQNYLDLLSCC